MFGQSTSTHSPFDLISWLCTGFTTPKRKKIVLTETIFSFFKNVPFPRGPIINLYYYVMVTPGPTTHTTINHLGGSGLSTPCETCWDSLYLPNPYYPPPYPYYLPYP